MPPGPPADVDPRLQPPDHPGDLGRLDRYRLIEPLGEGGMGVIYLGLDVRLRRKVALKVIRPRFAQSKAARSRFLKESRSLAAVRHDNVVTLYDVGEADGTPYLAMEYLRGVPLFAFLKRVPVPTLAQTLRIGREIASGLAAAHALGVVHRDIKPENVWLEAPHGRVKLIDFGLARPPAEDGIDLSKPGAVIGTPAYMPPEQARGLTVDPRADLYSLGVVLYEMTAGRLPFSGDNPVAVMIALATTPPVTPRAYNPAVPPGLESLILRLMAKDPAARPASAREVVAELARLEANPAAVGFAVPVADPSPVADPIPTADPATHVSPLPVGAIAVTAPAESAAAEDAFASLAAAALTPPPTFRVRAETGGVTAWVVAGATVLVAGVAAAIGVSVMTARPAPDPPTVAARPAEATAKAAGGRVGGVRPPFPFAVWKVAAPVQSLAAIGGTEAAVVTTGEGPGVRSFSSAPGAYTGWVTLQWPEKADAVGWVGAAAGRAVIPTDDGRVRFFDPATGRRVASVRAGPDAAAFAVSRDGTRLAVAPGPDGEPVRVTGLEPGVPDVSLAGHGDKRVRAAAFDPTGTRLATIAPDGFARVWDAATGAELAAVRTRFAADPTARFSVAFDPTGTRVLAYGPPGRAGVWDWQKTTELARWEAPDLGAAAFTPDGKSVVTGGVGRKLRVYPVGPGSTPAAEYDTADAPVLALAFSDAGDVLLTGHEKWVRAWDWRRLTTPEPVTPPAAPPSGFRSLFDGTTLVGWSPRPEDPAEAWGVVNGALAGERPPNGAGGWLLTDAEYGDFEWRFEYRMMTPGTDGGLAVRAGSAEPVAERLEVNLADDRNFRDLSGYGPSAWDRTGVLTRATEARAVAPLARLGEWNRVAVVAEGRRAFVAVNGVRVQDFVLPHDRKGRLGVQVHEGRIEYRNLWVREFEEPVPDRTPPP